MLPSNTAAGSSLTSLVSLLCPQPRVNVLAGGRDGLEAAAAAGRAGEGCAGAAAQRRLSQGASTAAPPCNLFCNRVGAHASTGMGVAFLAALAASTMARC